MSGCIAVINAGSSSIKCAVFEAGGDEKLLFKGQIEQIGVAPRMKISGPDGTVLAEQSWAAEGFDHHAGTREILQTAIRLLDGKQVKAVGHRVVHGGTDFAAPIRIDDKVIATLRTLIPLAPLHQPHNLAPIEAIAEAAPHIPQVACFDTAFHQGQPPLAQRLALPRKYSDEGVRRYGFHGLSYEFVASRLKDVVPELAA
ncbi:MAG: acetate kinase, partial [Sphingomonadales bacterium]